MDRLPAPEIVFPENGADLTTFQSAFPGYNALEVLRSAGRRLYGGRGWHPNGQVEEETACKDATPLFSKLAAGSGIKETTTGPHSSEAQPGRWRVGRLNPIPKRVRVNRLVYILLSPVNNAKTGSEMLVIFEFKKNDFRSGQSVRDIILFARLNGQAFLGRKHVPFK